MSNADTAAARERATRTILKEAGAQLAGKTPGPDHDPEGQRRVPRRHSYDVDLLEAKAKWRRVGDRSVRQGRVHRETLVQTARELRHQGWEKAPNREVREPLQQALADQLLRHLEFRPELDQVRRRPEPPDAARCSGACKAPTRRKLCCLNAAIAADSARPSAMRRSRASTPPAARAKAGSLRLADRGGNLTPTLTRSRSCLL